MRGGLTRPCNMLPRMDLASDARVGYVSIQEPPKLGPSGALCYGGPSSMPHRRLSRTGRIVACRPSARLDGQELVCRFCGCAVLVVAHDLYPYVKHRPPKNRGSHSRCAILRGLPT